MQTDAQTEIVSFTPAIVFCFPEHGAKLPLPGRGPCRCFMGEIICAKQEKDKENNGQSGMGGVGEGGRGGGRGGRGGRGHEGGKTLIKSPLRRPGT